MRRIRIARALAQAIVVSAALSTPLLGCGGSKKPSASTSTTAAGAGNVTSTASAIETFKDLSNDHVETPLSYPQSPPVGGDHSSAWQNCGVYTQPVKNENAVHSLEHGAVWITYTPDLAAPDVSKLAALATGKSHVLVTPYPNNPAPVVATAWGLQQKYQSASDPAIAAFVTKYMKGSQTPEPGTPCSKGIGTPE